MNNRQFLSEIHLDNTRTLDLKPNKTHDLYIQFFADFQHFFSLLELERYSWIITNLNSQRKKNNNYYMTKLRENNIYIIKLFPTKKWEFNYIIDTDQLKFNDTDVIDKSGYELFSQLLKQVSSDLITKQAFVFQKESV